MGFEKEDIQEKYNCVVNEERAIEVISAALHEYESGELGFFDGKNQVEEEYVNFLIEQGESDEFIINALFLLTTVTFGSSSSVFFNRLSKDPEVYKKYRWLFVPSEVVESKFIVSEDEKEDINNEEGGVIEFNKAWKEYLRPMGRQGASMHGWYHNCSVLCEAYNGNVIEFLKKHNNDSQIIRDVLQVSIGAKSEQKEFRRLGPKLTPLFLQWVGRYKLHDLVNLEDFGLPVDFQLCRIAVQTGIIEIDDDIYRADLAYKIFLPLVSKLCKEFNWEPRLVSEALWVIGSMGCTKDQRAIAPYYTCPLKPHCNGVLHKLDKDYWKFSNMEKIGKKFRRWEQDRLL